MSNKQKYVAVVRMNTSDITVWQERISRMKSAWSEGTFVPLLSVNRIFYQDRESLAGHRSMFDEALLEVLLRKAGFDSIKRRAYLEGENPELLLDTESRKRESLYMEARRP